MPNPTLHVTRPFVANPEDFLRRIAGVLESGVLTNNGPMVEELETRAAQFLGVSFCVAVSNATVGMSLVIRALGIKGEVLLPAFNFVSTAHSLMWLGLKPVFVDLGPGSWTLDPQDAAHRVTEQTGAIIGTHTWGYPCKIEALTALAAQHELPLLFDAAHAFGCSHRGQRVGSFGIAEVFSLHATKSLQAFEGGLVATNDVELAKEIRALRNFSFTAYDTINGIGTNAKLSEAHAAMGASNLAHFGKVRESARRVHDRYRERLAGSRYLKLSEHTSLEESNYHYLVAELTPQCPIERDKLIEELHSRRILARRYFYPGTHRLKPYFEDHMSQVLSETDDRCEKVIVLPAGAALTPDEADRVCATISQILEKAAP